MILVFNDFLTNANGSFIYVLLGGISYTAGVAFYISKFKYAHFVWHIFVLGGSIKHFFAVLVVLTS